jgi:hypothetical protein
MANRAHIHDGHIELLFHRPRNFDLVGGQCHLKRVLPFFLQRSHLLGDDRAFQNYGHCRQFLKVF